MFLINLLKTAVTLLIVLSIAVSSAYSNESEDHGAVYEFLKTYIKVDGNKFKTTRHAKLHILSPRGDDHADFYAHEGRWTKLKKVSITVSSANGGILYERKKKDITKTCGVSGSSLYSDICNYYSELKAPSYPFTIEYTYETESKTLFELRGAPIQKIVPVDLAQIHLEIDTDIPLRWKVTQLDINPTIQQKGSKVIYDWSAENLSGIDDIEYLPTGYNEPARLVLQADKFKLEDYIYDSNDWNSVGQFYNDLAEEKYFSIESPPPTLDATEQQDSLKSIYEEVISSTRYVAIQIGIGGWQPYSAELTQSRGFGDCKDLSTLLISRLRQAGIKAHPVLVNTRRSQITDPAFPSLSFNHVIAVAIIGTDTIWLDPTCSQCPLNEIPYTDEDIDVLLITDQGSQLVHIPKQKPANNLQTRHTLINIDSERFITFETTIQIAGEYATRLRNQIPRLTGDQELLYYRNLFADSKRKIEITDYEIDNLENINQPLVIKLTGHCTRRADQINNQMFCKPMFLDHPSSYENTGMKHRTLPINMYYPDRLEHHLTIQWDSSLNINSVDLPPNIELTSSFGLLSFEATENSSGVRIDYVKEYNDYQIDTDQLDEFREFQSVLKEITRQYVTFEQ